MEYRLLGKTGVEVSQLCLGTMPFGGPADEKESAKMFKSCRDIGINFFDCANVYEKGRSEKVLGKLMADSRDQLIITSKAYFPTSDDVVSRGSTRKHIMTAVGESLKRLKKRNYWHHYMRYRYPSLKRNLR